MQQSLAAMPFLPQPVLMFNLVCTNVPGPMVPLYANGRELLTYYPHVPCGSDVGIGVAISSYNKGLYFGVTYDGQAAPDGEIFRDFLVETYQELRAAAVVAPVAFGMPSRRAAEAAEPEQPAAEGPQQPRPPRVAEAALQTGAAEESERQVVQAPQQEEPPRAAEAALQPAATAEPEQPAAEAPQQDKPPRRAAVPEQPAREAPQPEEPAAAAATAPEAEPAAAPDPAPARQPRTRNHRGRRAGAAKAGQNPR